MGAQAAVAAEAVEVAVVDVAMGDHRKKEMPILGILPGSQIIILIQQDLKLHSK